MTIREQIIKQMDKPFIFDEGKESSPYNILKQCIELDMTKFKSMAEAVELEDRINGWFKGVINSLYYRPNKLVLVLEGDDRIGNTQFIFNLLPVYIPRLSAFGTNIKNINVYSNLIIDYEFTKNQLVLPSMEDFTVTQGEYPCDKRLASYCSTTNKWNFPQRKNFIIVPVKKINQELFNSIDKELLWIEIFNKFKQEL